MRVDVYLSGGISGHVSVVTVLFLPLSSFVGLSSAASLVVVRGVSSFSSSSASVLSLSSS